ncbi:hypothetical protein [Shewanella sp. UCD-KL21]|uniref:hypothetical protein n=1 Tax=Shewanella sp. UCD-KL21 TaxID=1917164 RepID=UPI00097118E8|nr:hypothetical protein [Shewanella sp. UCD-KL21]
MNNIETNTAIDTTTSNKMIKPIALAATVIITMLASSSSFAHQFDIDAQGAQAIKHHQQLMKQHIKTAEQEFSAEIAQHFEQQLQTAEHKFLTQACAKNGLEFDTQSETCSG